MDIEKLLIPVDDYWKKEIQALNESTNSNTKFQKIELNEYITLIELIILIEEANYKIQELEEKIEELETPDDEDGYYADYYHEKQMLGD